MKDKLDLSALDIGISSTGMAQYREDLRASLLVSTTDKLNEEVENILSVIDSGWQGVSRDRFERQLRNMCELMGEDLRKEYDDLEARLTELESFYYEQDLKLIEE